ncbi:hypothetical protein [Metabacillus malikii]|uniref:Lipoprotein n=1 Tax=Metabacillus malikii TaxID=1504265 RepID=A0ABT9ZME7_9BACI|nr:hypothetical protein [Metabacillus malikii]MDQ0233429.1 hypothetical protein [Metabacillus malikii]
MKKLSLTIAIVFILVGCSHFPSSVKITVGEQEDSTSNSELTYKDKQKEIVDFINEDMNEIASYEKKANEALAKVSGENFRNDKELHTVLTNEVLPEYEKAIEKAKSLEVTTDELNPIKEEILGVLDIYYKALLLEKEALEKNDAKLIEQSNAMVDDYLNALSDYHKNMETLAEKYGIDYQRE